MAATKTQTVSMLVVAAFAFGAAAVWLVPWVTGPIGLAFGAAAALRRERLAGAALITVAACTLVGIALHQLPPSFFN